MRPLVVSVVIVTSDAEDASNKSEIDVGVFG